MVRNTRYALAPGSSLTNARCLGQQSAGFPGFDKKKKMFHGCQSSIFLARVLPRSIKSPHCWAAYRVTGAGKCDRRGCPCWWAAHKRVRLGQISLPTQPRLFRVNSTSTINCPRDNRGRNDQEYDANRDQHWNCRAAMKWHVLVPAGMRSNQDGGNSIHV